MEAQWTDKQLVILGLMLASQFIGILSMFGLFRELLIYLKQKEDRNE